MTDVSRKTLALLAGCRLENGSPDSAHLVLQGDGCDLINITRACGDDGEPILNDATWEEILALLGKGLTGYPDVLAELGE